MAASKQVCTYVRTYTHTHMGNAVLLVWGLLRLAITIDSMHTDTSDHWSVLEMIPTIALGGETVNTHATPPTSVRSLSKVMTNWIATSFFTLAIMLENNSTHWEGGGGGRGGGGGERGGGGGERGGGEGGSRGGGGGEERRKERKKKRRAGGTSRWPLYQTDR